MFPKPAAAPRAARRPTVRNHHHDLVSDDYEWLRDKEDPEVIAFLTEQNSYTESRTEHLSGLREQIFHEIESRTQETDLSVPVRRGQWWYYSRTVAGQQYGIHCRAPLPDPGDWTPPNLGDQVVGEQILLDGNVEAVGHDFFSLGSFEVSLDGTRLLYGVDVLGDERYTIRVRDLETGTMMPDEIPETFAGATFSPDGSSIVYTTVDESWRPDRVWLHTLGTPVTADTELFHEPDERFWVGAGFTSSERYLVIGAGSSITNEERLIPADDLHGTAHVVWPRREGIEYSSSHAVIDGTDVLYIVHNDGAVDFELVRVHANDPEGARSVIMPHQPGQRILGVETFRDWVVAGYHRDGLTRLAMLSYHDDALTEITFDEPLYTVGMGSNPEWAPPLLRLGYGSFVTPGTVFDYQVATGELFLRKQQPVLGGYDPDDYAQERLRARAEDGAAVPISVVWRRSFGEFGSAPRPVHLYGYGSYEHAIDPSFSVARLSLLDRGVVFAIAHVRGGGELGRDWYEQGKLSHKRNTFTDFVSCARHLVDSGYTTPDLMVAEGGSAGGLLMGAVCNLAPELFAGILAEVPFVDALTTILDPTLPLTVIEWDEWGDPLHDPDVYAYIKSYSPYENIRTDASYPRILAVTSLNDTRVMYAEPAKWVAKLQSVGADALLKTELVAGHGGVSGRYNAWRDRAFQLAWLLDVLNLASPERHLAK